MLGGSRRVRSVGRRHSTESSSRSGVAETIVVRISVSSSMFVPHPRPCDRNDRAARDYSVTSTARARGPTADCRLGALTDDGAKVDPFTEHRRKWCLDRQWPVPGL